MSAVPGELFARAFAAFQAGRHAEAEAGMRQVLAAQPDHAGALQLLGATLGMQGRAAEARVFLEAARTALERALAARPEPPGAREALVGVLNNLSAAQADLGGAREAIPHLERAAALAPRAWQVLANLAAAYLDAGRFAEAAQAARRALVLQPESNEARNSLGNALAALGDAQGAAACYRAAIVRDARDADAHSNLGILQVEQGERDAAQASLGEALAIRPDHPSALTNLGMLLQESGRREEAMALYARALEVNPRAAHAAYNLGIGYLFEHDFARGWDLHEARFHTAPQSTPPRDFPMPVLGPGDWGHGHRVAIWKEQGVGDQIVYSTLATQLEARGEAFVLEVDRRLVAAYARAHPDWKVVAGEDSDAAFARCDRHIAVGSLPRLLRPTIESFDAQPRALLAADPGRAAGYGAQLAAPGTRVIGISWRSFQPKTRGHVQRRKSAPLAAFRPLSRRGDLRLVDLQYGDTATEREAFTLAGGRLARLEGLDLFADLDGVLAAIAACDLVVTTSNVTAHLAAAQGKRTLLVYLEGIAPFHYWEPGPDGRCLWYPSLEVVSAGDARSWERALELVHERIDA